MPSDVSSSEEYFTPKKKSRKSSKRINRYADINVKPIDADKDEDDFFTESRKPEKKDSCEC